jgi:hypothetical protein
VALYAVGLIRIRLAAVDFYAAAICNMPPTRKASETDRPDPVVAGQASLKPSRGFAPGERLDASDVDHALGAG